MGSLIRFVSTTLYIEFLVTVIQSMGKVCYFLLGIISPVMHPFYAYNSVQFNMQISEDKEYTLP